MLTIPEAVAAQAAAAAEKSALLARPAVFAVRSALAGAWVGIGVVIMLTAGGPLRVEGSVLAPLAPLVQGLVFGVALTVVVIGGGELATSAMMVLTQGGLARTVRWGRAAVVLLATMLGNLAGAVVWSVVVHLSGLMAPDTPAGGALTAVLAHKTSETDLQLLTRGILCNVMVCLAVWMAARLTSEGARIAVVFACVMVFITSGFEHVVANMTALSLGVLGDVPGVTLGAFARNMLLVGLGNTIGGAVIVGAAYAVGSLPKRAGTGAGTAARSGAGATAGGVPDEERLDAALA
ncbi:formate/nitrite transporter family protein [Cellulomonas marina]|uniref:Nitrite transporter NirC n=1 Tax=Cellulomonas marina TaxID=988821 RepID=A0A1I0XFD3_9CELL|nr:formate/nitrite transporter family protein [Cellulomonas marina]GIG29858.1 nitrite transporter NirC [Cellulomonas marina]SFA99732.1 nitrite transporter NirC [Cellulomonas marina]